MTVDAALDRLPCAFVSFADDGTILAANDRLLALLGRDRADVVGARLDSIFAAGGAAFYHTYLFPLLRVEGRAEEIYLVLRSADGGSVPVLAYGARGEVNECVFVSVTRREKYQDEIARARDRVIGILGHDLRVPLTSVALNAETLLRHEELSGDGRRTALAILASARRAARMTTELLDFARIRFAGGLPIHRQPADLRAVAQKVIAELRGIHPAALIELAFDGDCRGSWDADRAAQVIANLTANALEHGRANRPVAVRLDGRGAEVVLEVHNAADEMPSGDLFTPFHQRRGSTGLGLGLFIVREIMEAHGGTVAARAAAGEFCVTAVWPRNG